ncbi:MAG: response regulator [Gallionella sp.]
MLDSPLDKPTTRFLVVDDQRSIRAYITTILAEFDAKITEADNGEEALRLIKAQQFDVIFLDVNMPGMSGLAVCEHVRRELSFDQVPIIIMTAIESRDVIGRAFAAGATDYVNKTYCQYELIVRTRAILARRNSEHQLYLAKKEAELTNRAKSDFLINMSHELRTPLNAIIGFSELLESDIEMPLTAGQLEQIGHVTLAGWHLLDLINDILDLAKIEGGKIPIELASVNVFDLIDECVLFNQAHAIKRNITIKIIAAERYSVSADPTRLKQVLVNLLSNAIKYNNPSGHVTFSVEKKPGERVRITVSDTGPGIPADKLPLLFQPFSRLGAERSSIEGHGVGLALTKQLAELMGGTVGVTSTVGIGSFFWVELTEMRAVKVQEKSSRELDINALDEALSALSPRKILYIEDNFINQILVGKILSKFPQFELRCADSGEEGLDMIGQDPPDLLLLDMQLSGIDGLEVLAQLQDKSTMPVLAFSADAMPENVKAALDSGAHGYLTKPLDAKLFKRTLLEHLSTR